jgi:ADP-L-glycero-D-manno-heptose 6-epimerase
MAKPSMILITGAAGLIGSGVVRHLNDLKYTNLLLVDDLKQGEKWKNLVGKQFIDILSRHALFDYLQGREEEIEAIIHLGACSDTVETNADYLLENNYRYTIRLAEWALKYNKRFIYASSAATYGDGNLGFDDDESTLETLRPLNMYAYSKHLVDLWLKREGVLNRVVGLKYFNVFGPNEYHKGRMASMVLKMCRKAQVEGSIQLYKSNDSKYEDGGQMRDFIYVKDAAKMTCAFLNPQFSSVHGIYNIGLGKPSTWNELATALFTALGKKLNVQYIDMPSELSHQYQNYTCAAMDKFNKIFSSDPLSIQKTPLSEAVRDYVQGYLVRNERW